MNPGASLVPTVPKSQTGTVIGLMALAAGGYAAYRFWYLPYTFRQRLNAAAAAAGLSPKSYLQRIGAAACQAYGAAYGVPPSVSGGVCSELASAAEEVLKAAPSILGGVGSGTKSLLTDVGSGVGSALHSLTNEAAYGIGKSGSLVKDAAVNVVAGLKYISVEPVKLVASGVATGVKAVEHAVSKVLPWNW